MGAGRSSDGESSPASTIDQPSFVFTAQRTGRYYLAVQSLSIGFLYGTATGLGNYVLTAEAMSLPPVPPPADDYESQMDATTPLITTSQIP